MSDRLFNIPAEGASHVPVFGISEWQNYYRGDEPDLDPTRLIDECVQVHADTGIDAIVWEAGRSTLMYKSDLPHTTRQYELGMVPKPQRVSADYIHAVFEHCCPLRRGIELGHERGMPILGRLCMNRCYGGEKNIDSTSRFSLDHPDWLEVGKLGEPIPTRMCYGIDQVQQERTDILLEVQRIGVDGLVLDYCRQMPLLAYHDALVQPYIAKTGHDPRAIDTENPDDYADWFQFRADVLTDFMRQLRKRIRDQEQVLEQRCPIVARVPDYAPWLMIACGIDIETWLAEDLIDATMLSPFPRICDDVQSYPQYHVDIAHRHGKLCIGGVGSKGLQNTGAHNGKPCSQNKPDAKTEYACRVANQQYAAGVDAMSLYQSESLCRREYLTEMIQHLGDKQWIANAASDVPEPSPDDELFFVGKDWHSRIEDEGLGTARCGNLAL